jgi:hypothetical protein
MEGRPVHLGHLLNAFGPWDGWFFVFLGRQLGCFPRYMLLRC